MLSPLKKVLQSQLSQDALLVAGAIVGILFVAGFVGYGNLLATLPGLIVVVLIVSLVFWIIETVR